MFTFRAQGWLRGGLGRTAEKARAPEVTSRRRTRGRSLPASAPASVTEAPGAAGRQLRLGEPRSGGSGAGSFHSPSAFWVPSSFAFNVCTESDGGQEGFITSILKRMESGQQGGDVTCPVSRASTWRSRCWVCTAAAVSAAYVPAGGPGAPASAGAGGARGESGSVGVKGVSQGCAWGRGGAASPRPWDCAFPSDLWPSPGLPQPQPRPCVSPEPPRRS